ncbi:TPA: pentapeptide repeat-containing protein [Streptococcus suis]
MGRRKSKKKKKVENRRLNRIKLGKNVPFTLSNYPKKLYGIQNSYQYLINVHKCCFNGGEFKNVRYRAGHLTHCFMKKAKFENIDFIFVNLKNTSFKGSTFYKVVFNGCNLRGADFSLCSFKDTYFINCNLSEEQKEHLSGNTRIINKLEYDVPDSIKMLTFSISQNKSLEKYRILSIKNTKLNKVMINLLLSKFTEAQIVKFLKKVSITNKKQFRTIHDYIDSIAKYYHSMI